jgi:hypothetical protein
MRTLENFLAANPCTLFQNQNIECAQRDRAAAQLFDPARFERQQIDAEMPEIAQPHTLRDLG